MVNGRLVFFVSIKSITQPFANLKQHSSKTCKYPQKTSSLFWNHSKQHSSKTSQKKILWFRNRTIRPSKASASHGFLSSMITYSEQLENNPHLKYIVENHKLALVLKKDNPYDLTLCIQIIVLFPFAINKPKY